MAGLPLAEIIRAVIDVDLVRRQRLRGIVRLRPPGDMAASAYRWLVKQHGWDLGGAPVGYRTRTPFIHEVSRVVNRNPQNVAFAVKGVVEALIEEGYDPTVEVVRILKGEPDPDRPGQRMYQVPTDVRLRFAAELMKFVHPTKKAVEVEDKTPPRGRELDERLQALLARVQRNGMQIDTTELEQVMVDTVGTSDIDPDALDML